MVTQCTRRAAWTGLLAATLATRTGHAAPTAMPDAPHLIVAGPGGGQAGQWGSVLAAALGRTLQLPAPLTIDTIGGADGVTAANQFQALSPIDGSTVLLAPGDAALAGLVGESRVRFQTGGWVPLWGTGGEAALLTRAKLARGTTLRMAVGNFAGPELAALLALDLLGVDVVPVPLDPELGNELPPQVDACFLRGPALRAAMLRLGQPAFTLGAIAPTGDVQRDPALPTVPTAQELVRSGNLAGSRNLLAAFAAVCAAANLAECLVLPLLAPATVVAWWRQGCTGLESDTQIQTEATRRLQSPMPTSALAANLAALNVDAPALIELRRWLADHHHWRPT